MTSKRGRLPGSAGENPADDPGILFYAARVTLPLHGKKNEKGNDRTVSVQEYCR
jgi:hypothetical protein